MGAKKKLDKSDIRLLVKQGNNGGWWVWHVTGLDTVLDLEGPFRAQSDANTRRMTRIREGYSAS